MGKNRDRLGIVAAVLSAVRAGEGKTRIMYGANLSFMLLEKYLHLVVAAGFVQVDGSSYLLTEQGENFLERYKRFSKRHARVQNIVENLDRERQKLSGLCDGPWGAGSSGPVENMV